MSKAIEKHINATTQSFLVLISKQIIADRDEQMEKFRKPRRTENTTERYETGLRKV